MTLSLSQMKPNPPSEARPVPDFLVALVGTGRPSLPRDIDGEGGVCELMAAGNRTSRKWLSFPYCSKQDVGV